MIDEYDLAYIAGYTDGDGCFHIRKQTRPTTGTAKYFGSFIICSTDLNIIEFMTKKFPGTKHLTGDRKKRDRHKTQYHFILRGKKSLEFSQRILPYLVEKRAEAETLIKFLNTSSNEERASLVVGLKEIKENNNLVSNLDKEWLSKLVHTKTPTELDFAYLAGLIDAECCLSVYRSTTKTNPNFIYKILLQCGNTKLPIFPWLLERFGGQVHFVECRSKNVNRRDFLTWRLSSKSLANILPKIFPYLKHKKPICKELMKFTETNVFLEGKISRNSPKFREFYRPVLEERDRIFHKIHELNRKGIQST